MLKNFLAPKKDEGFSIEQVQTLLSATGSSLNDARTSIEGKASKEVESIEASAVAISALQGKLSSAKQAKRVSEINLSEANALLMKLS